MVGKQHNKHFVILAAGIGKRMQSTQPKVLHEIGKLPLIGHILHKLNDYPDALVNIIINDKPEANAIRHFVGHNFKQVNFIVQPQQLGTADALKEFLTQYNKKINPDDNIVVLVGDAPFVQTQLMDTICNELNQNTALVVVGTNIDNPTGYGRIIKDGKGKIKKIVECSQANETEKQITLCNSGIIGFKYAIVKKLIDKIKINPENGEYYLTKIIELAYDAEIKMSTLDVPFETVMGINNKLELSKAENIFQNNKRSEAMKNGVILRDSSSTFFAFDTKLGQNVEIEPNVHFGKSVCVGDNTTIKSFCYLEGVKIANNTTIGPFARIRPNSTIGNNVQIGNFVEIKQSIIGDYSKINHLSYAGDSTIGKKVNVGAGVITCNYDGKNKHKTNIKDDVFIGSNCAIVAPITINKGVFVGAGSTITKDIPENQLVIARAKQKKIKTIIGD